MKQETTILTIVFAVGAVILVLYAAFGNHDNRLIGSAYIEYTRDILRFAPDDAVWEAAGEHWVYPNTIPAEVIDPDTEEKEEALTLAKWDRDLARMVFFERDIEAETSRPAAVWDRHERRWHRLREVEPEQRDEETDEREGEPAEPGENQDTPANGNDVEIAYEVTDEVYGAAPMPAKDWRLQRGVSRARAGETGVYFDWSRTIGLWFAAICSIFVLSFLYRDNPYYKFTEALVVGVSAAYSMVLAFWTMVVPNMIGRLWPEGVQMFISPEHDAARNLWYLIVLMLSIMLLWRLAPKGGWIARWPLAFIIGVFAGIRLIGFLDANFAIQIQATILPLFVYDDGEFSFWGSLRNLVIVLGVMACLTYFFFSIEHKGFVGRTARLGIFILMVTFGAGFAYTVMGRITLLTQRIEFLFNEWLWLLPPG